jgi:hypothetical protein
MKNTYKVLLCILTAACALCAAAHVRAQDSGFRWQPEQASKIAPRVDLLFDFLLVVSTMIAGGICLLIVVFAFKYRRGNPADRSNAPNKNWKLESAWIGLPMLLALFTTSMRSLPARSISTWLGSSGFGRCNTRKGRAKWTNFIFRSDGPSNSPSPPRT